MNYYPIRHDFLKSLEDLKITYKSILKAELKLPVHKNFFQFQGNYYPIKIKFNINNIDQKRSIVGSFNPLNLTITLNYHYYQFLDSTQRLNLIRHELAHYIDYILRGDAGHDHDAHYHRLCQSYEWNQEVYQATIDKSIIEKIQHNKRLHRHSEKLIALSQNNNSWEEAQSALLKAKQLLQGVQEKFIAQNDDYIALELTSGKRFTQKLNTILQILELFHCQCILLTTPGHFTLEAITTLKQKEAIEELYMFLLSQIDQWFDESKKHHPQLHRSSFYQGVLRGLKEKMQLQEDLLYSHQKALIISSKQELQKHFQILYPRTGKSSQKTQHDLHSFMQGKNMGMRMELKNKLRQSSTLLSFFH